MHCPLCHSDLNGGLIYQTFFDQHGDHDKALETASHYGATATEGHWGRQIGIYDFEKDRTVANQCPDCYGEWPR
jgi:hypothetical protein